MFEPVKRIGLSDQVYRSLRQLIIQGKIAPGEKLPSERELALRFQVNRGAIREALSRLEENRLVRVKQGSGAMVLDWMRSFRFDFLNDILFENGKMNYRVFRSVLELREILGPEMAGYASRRAKKDDIRELLRIGKELIGARNEPERFQELEYNFNQVLARASGNLAFEFMVNSIGWIYLENAEIFRLGIEPLLKSADKYLGVAKAVRDGNERRARSLMRELFKVSGEAFYKLVDGFSKGIRNSDKKRERGIKVLVKKEENYGRRSKADRPLKR